MAFFTRAFRSILGSSASPAQPQPEATAGKSVNAITRPDAGAAANSLALGNDALAQGQLAQALQHYSQAASTEPGNPKAHLNRGFVLLEQGQYAEAEQSLQRALELVPSAHEMAHELHYLLGRARAGQQDWQGAAQHWSSAVALHGAFAFAWRDLALAQEQLGQFANAIDSMTRAIALTPNATQEKLDMARLLLADKKPNEALRWVDPILANASQQSEGVMLAASLVRADALYALRRFEEALSMLESAANVYPNDAEVLYSLGNVLMELKQHGRALSLYEKVQALAPKMVGAWFNSGLALGHLAREPEALAYFDRAQALAPDLLQIWQNRASLHLNLLDCEASIAQSLAGLNVMPSDGDLHMNLFTNYLLLGNFERAWPEFEWRWRATTHTLAYPPYLQPRWHGHEPLAGKSILLFPEQGLGDVIQFLRYVPMVAQRAAQVLMVMPPALYPVLGRLPPNCKLKQAGQDIEASDFQCPLMSLPLAFGTTVATIPNQLPYIHVESERITHWNQRLGVDHGLRVGLVWSGNAIHSNDHNRSISLAKLRKAVGQVPGCQFTSLQLEMRESDRDTYADWPELQHFGDELKSFADTAAIASCMDIVLSVDTSVAHLVGALGLPLWLLIPYVPDWRWMLNRNDTPWYPQARLFRQDQSRQWEPVLQQVAAELALMAQGKLKPQGDGAARQV